MISSCTLVGQRRAARAVSCTRCFSGSAHRSTSSPPTEHHDLVVVGGGPAGLALSAALAASDSIAQTHRITLLEAAPLSNVRSWAPAQGQWSNRVSSITAENAAFLSRTGIWSHVDHARTRGIDEMQVWDGLSDARIEFSSPLSSSLTSSPSPSAWDPSPRRAPMATLVENLNLQRAALRRIEESGSVELVDGMRVKSIDRDEGGWPLVRVENAEGTESRSIRARLLIGADGANSPVKSYSKIDTFGWAYDRHGVVASLELDPSNLGEGTTTAWQRFLPEGPVAFLPLSDTSASLVWSTTPTIASLLKSLPLEALPHLINLAFALPYPQLSSLLSTLQARQSTTPPSSDELVPLFRDILLAHQQSTYSASAPSDPLPPLVTAVQPSSVASFPLRLSHVDSYLGLPDDGKDSRTVLVGDAAHTVHPLAGQGLNMGLADAAELVRVLEGVVEKGGDVGSYISLLPYPRSRYLANHVLLSACDHLSTLYSSQASPLVWLRSTGLEAINELDSVKRLLMGGAGARAGEGGAGVWGAVAGALEGLGQVRDVAGLAVGAVAGALKRRATDFIVKGR
ncbi:hypothetical protein JCM5296_007468 [Sporobolomyces johnsonii]